MKRKTETVADSVTCDQCGKVAAAGSTGNWHKVSLRREPSNPVYFGHISGDYCTLECLIKKAKARRRADRETRVKYPMPTGIFVTNDNTNTFTAANTIGA